MALESQLGQNLGQMLPGMVQRVFGPNICPIDGRYITMPLQLDRATSAGPGRAVVTFNMPHVADIVWKLVLRVTMPRLPEGARWKRRAPDLLFDDYDIQQGGQVFSTVSLIKNNAIARARDRWPTFNNNPDNVADPSRERWIVSIPILPELVVPLIKMYWHDSRMHLERMFNRWEDLIDGPVGSDFDGTDFEISLDCEGVFLERAPRAACANSTKPVLCRGTPLAVADICLVKQDRAISRDRIDRGMTNYRLHQNLDLCVTHVVLAYTTDATLPANAHPLRHLEIRGNGAILAKYDYIDLEELNWLKCGLLSPMGELKGNSECNTFLYLVPFCADAFSDYPTSWLEASRLERLEFLLSSDCELPAGYINILAQNLNIQKYATGLTRMMYVP